MLNSIRNTLFLTSFALCACDSADTAYDKQTTLLNEVIATNNSVVLVDSNHNEAVIVDVQSRDSAGARRVAIPAAPFHVERRNGVSGDVLILSAGYTGSKDLLQQPAALSRLGDDGTVTTYTLGTNPFDSMVSDPEGRFVLLLRRNLNDVLIENMNEVAIVDLDADPDAENAVTFSTLENTPYNIFFSQNFSIEGTVRRFACIASMNSFYIFDLEHLNRKPTAIALGQNDGNAVVIEQTIFDSQTPRMYLRARSTNDVFSIKLTPRETTPDRNDFATAIDIIGVGTNPSDMTLYYEGDESRLLVVAQQTKEIYFIDVATGKTLPVAFAPGSRIERVLYFEKTQGDTTTQHALIWAPGQRNFYVVDFAGISEMLGRNIRLIGTSHQPALELLPVFDGNRLLLMHSGLGMSIIDLDRETIAPYASSEPLSLSYLDEERKQFWVSPPDQNRVAFVNILDGETDDMLLDHNVLKVVPVFASGRLAILHRSDIGLISVIDVEHPDRDHAFVIKGFMLEDIF